MKWFRMAHIANITMRQATLRSLRSLASILRLLNSSHTTTRERTQNASTLTQWKQLSHRTLLRMVTASRLCGTLIQGSRFRQPQANTREQLIPGSYLPITRALTLLPRKRGWTNLQLLIRAWSPNLTNSMIKIAPRNQKVKRTIISERARTTTCICQTLPSIQQIASTQETMKNMALKYVATAKTHQPLHLTFTIRCKRIQNARDHIHLLLNTKTPSPPKMANASEWITSITEWWSCRTTVGNLNTIPSGTAWDSSRTPQIV